MYIWQFCKICGSIGIPDCCEDGEACLLEGEDEGCANLAGTGAGDVDGLFGHCFGFESIILETTEDFGCCDKKVPREGKQSEMRAARADIKYCR